MALRPFFCYSIGPYRVPYDAGDRRLLSGINQPPTYSPQSVSTRERPDAASRCSQR